MMMLRHWEGCRRRRASLLGLALFVVALAAPSGASAAWSLTQLPGPAAKIYLLDVDCPSTSLCVATGTDNLIASTTDPTGGPGAWRYGYAGDGPWEKTNEWPTSDISGKQVESVSCPSVSLCVAVTDKGFIYTTTNPTGPASAWSVTEIPHTKAGNIHLFGVSCPTTTFCAAVTGKRGDEGKILTTSNPGGGLSAWQVAEFPGQDFEFRGISCPTTSLCVAVSEDGRIVASTDPAGGASAWALVGSPGGSGLAAVDCVAAPLCVSGNQTGVVLSSANPVAAGGWQAVHGGGTVQITGAACASASQCLLADNNGDVLTSTDPTGGAGAWSFTNLLRYTEAEGNGLFGASCPSPSLCLITGARGQILSSTDPFAKIDPKKAANPGGKSGKGRRRGPKRPRSKIVRVLLPFKRQVHHHHGKVMIRFHSVGRAYGFVCKLDRHRWRPCRSPKRMLVRVGKHVFRVRAIGSTGLRGPAAVEHFQLGPYCKITFPPHAGGARAAGRPAAAEGRPGATHERPHTCQA
jgi:hypothetical protein